MIEDFRQTQVGTASAAEGSAPCTFFATQMRDRFGNPKVIESSSPGAANPRAYLGPCPNEIINRNAVAAFPPSRPWATLAATALRLELMVARGPKVAASPNPVRGQALNREQLPRSMIHK